MAWLGNSAHSPSLLELILFKPTPCLLWSWGGGGGAKSSCWAWDCSKWNILGFFFFLTRSAISVQLVFLTRGPDFPFILITFQTLDFIHYFSLSRHCPNLNSIAQDRVYPSELRISLQGSSGRLTTPPGQGASWGGRPGAKQGCSAQIKTEQMMGGGPIEDLVFKK